jgi:hypothetical protein
MRHPFFYAYLALNVFALLLVGVLLIIAGISEGESIGIVVGIGFIVISIPTFLLFWVGVRVVVIAIARYLGLDEAEFVKTLLKGYLLLHVLAAAIIGVFSIPGVGWSDYDRGYRAGLGTLSNMLEAEKEGRRGLGVPGPRGESPEYRRGYMDAVKGD